MRPVPPCRPRYGAPRDSTGVPRGFTRPCPAPPGQTVASPVPLILAAPGFPVGTARPEPPARPGGGCPLPEDWQRGGVARAGAPAASAPRPDGPQRALTASPLPSRGAVRGPGGGDSSAEELRTPRADEGGFPFWEIPPPSAPTAAQAPKFTAGRDLFRAAAHRPSLPRSGPGQEDVPCKSHGADRGGRLPSGWRAAMAPGEVGIPDGSDPHSGDTTGSCPSPLNREAARGAGSEWGEPL